MRFVSFRTENGEIHIGVVKGEQLVDLTRWLTMSGDSSNFDMVDLIARGEEGLAAVRAALEVQSEKLSAAGALLPLKLEMLAAPIPRPRKNVMCLGRNYAEHAAESFRSFNEKPPEKATPEYPAVFTKAPTAVTGPFDDIPYDAGISEQIDWEGELAIVVGTRGKNITRDRANDYIFGYMALNDISARDIQRRHGNQYFKGKSLDGACPTGPWIVTADEVGDANNLELWTRVNGVEKQHDNTHSMMLDVQGIVEAISLGMTVEPGDIIATGTPVGVGHARTPAEYLRPGDIVEVEIEKVGKIRNRVSPE